MAQTSYNSDPDEFLMGVFYVICLHNISVIQMGLRRCNLVFVLFLGYQSLAMGANATYIYIDRSRLVIA